MKRLLTASILIPFFLWVVLASPQYLFIAVVVVLACICFYEYAQIATAHLEALDGLRPGPAAYAGGIAFLIVPEDEWLLAVMAVLFLMLLALRASNLAACLPAAAFFALGLIYIFGSWKSAIGLHALSPWWMLFATAINWAGDTFALYGGKAFGRHKLAPLVSPAKTWEGAASSLIATCVLGFLYIRYFLPQVPISQALILCVVGNIAGQLGDLAESAFKRGAGVKDSGTLLPGHGGWLDRVDSTLFSMPVIYWLLRQPWFLQ
jgi:phosphatidate cytidylyltransferase